jgi:hypothetical protein
MTPTEVLNEISKMPLVVKKELLEKLTREIKEADEVGLDSGEESFLEGLRQKGLLSETPAQVSDHEIRQNFKRVEVQGEPLSETIIKERG